MADHNDTLLSSSQDLNDYMGPFNSDDDNVNNPLHLLNIESKYYNIEDILASIPDTTFKYKSIHINIKSLPDKFERLKIFIQRFKDAGLSIDFILICETFLTSLNAEFYQLPGYKFIHKCRSTINCGGVGMYIRNDIHFKLRDDIALFCEGEFESIFIETTYGDKSAIVGEVYRIPSSNELLSLNRFETITEMIKNINRHVIIGTDQNFDYLKIHSHKNTADLLNQFFSCGLVPCITKPTRITHSTATLIDNVYVKPQHEDKLHSGIILFEFADHLPVFLFSAKHQHKNKEPLIFKYRQLNASTLDTIKSNLEVVDWTQLNDMNIDDAYTYFSDKLQGTLELFAPEKTARISNKFIIRDPWVTKGILKSSKMLDKLFKAKLTRPDTHPCHVKYIKYRNLFNKIKKKSKLTHYANILQLYKDDIKNT
jgi:hypothetical protein